MANFVPEDDLEPPSYDYNDSSLRGRINEARDSIRKISYQTIDWWNAQPLYKKVILVILDIIVLGLIGVSLFYHETLVHYAVEYSDKWSQKKRSWFIIAFMLFIISFPPMLGFSFTSTMAGVFYGVSWKGWSVIAIGSISGSVAAFMVFRYMFKTRAQALISANQKLYAFSSILQENNSYWLITLIRLCPFPYSLTNGALAGIPGISVINFALGSIISSPKLVLYLFIGAKLKDFGKAKDPASKFVDLASIVLTFIFLILTGWILYVKTSNKIQELEAQRGLTGPQDGTNEDFENFLENDNQTDNATLDTNFDIDDYDNGNRQTMK